MVKAGSNKVWHLASIALVLLIAGLCLSACDDDLSPNKVDSSVQTARALTGSTPAPTVTLEDNGIGISVVILGVRTYYPDNPGEKVGVSIYNSNNKTFYLQTCQGVVLQRQNPATGEWTDIAPDVPCPPTGPETYAVAPNTSPSADFVFKRTVPFPGQKMDIPGMYQLTLTYYVDCAPGENTPDYCIGKRTVSTVEFPIDAGTGGASVNATPVATPKS